MSRRYARFRGIAASPKQQGDPAEALHDAIARLESASLSPEVFAKAAESIMEIVDAALGSTDETGGEPEPVAARGRGLPHGERAQLRKLMGIEEELPPGAQLISGGKAVARTLPHGGFSLGYGGARRIAHPGAIKGR